MAEQRADGWWWGGVGVGMALIKPKQKCTIKWLDNHWKKKYDGRESVWTGQQHQQKQKFNICFWVNKMYILFYDQSKRERPFTNTERKKKPWNVTYLECFQQQPTSADAALCFWRNLLRLSRVVCFALSLTNENTDRNKVKNCRLYGACTGSVFLRKSFQGPQKYLYSVLSVKFRSSHSNFFFFFRFSLDIFFSSLVSLSLRPQIVQKQRNWRQKLCVEERRSSEQRHRQEQRQQ